MTSFLFKLFYGEKTCSYSSAMLERCHVCKGKEHKVYDEIDRGIERYH